MREIGAFEAKTHLSTLLDEVAAGETVLITKRGRPTAMLVPADRPDRKTAARAAAAAKGAMSSSSSSAETAMEGRPICESSVVLP